MDVLDAPASDGRSSPSEAVMDNQHIEVLSRLGVIEYFVADMYAHISIQQFGENTPAHIAQLEDAIARITDGLTIPVKDPAMSMHLSAEIQDAFRAMTARIRNAAAHKLEPRSICDGAGGSAST
jgi:hypothetical protein